ncbi:hypothetical protein WJ438_00170 [Streptomyces sp. GD-15H]|uniref:hypothetical protein n=1 Tax=Streptomyces sp. GD-15H TaxID=3129112 RepID=UPI00324A2B99
MLLLFTAVCCAAPVSNAISAYVALQTGLQDDDDGGIADGGSAADTPARMLTAYKKAASQVGKYVPTCQGMRWPILAGIAKVESNHAIGRNIADHGDIRPKIYGVLLNGSGPAGTPPSSRTPMTESGTASPAGSGRSGPSSFCRPPGRASARMPAGTRQPIRTTPTTQPWAPPSTCAATDGT